MSSQDKRSHNRLLSGEIEQAGVKLSCACNTGVKMIQNLLIQLRKSAFLMQRTLRASPRLGCTITKRFEKQSGFETLLIQTATPTARVCACVTCWLGCTPWVGVSMLHALSLSSLVPLQLYFRRHQRRKSHEAPFHRYEADAQLYVLHHVRTSCVRARLILLYSYSSSS